MDDGTLPYKLMLTVLLYGLVILIHGFEKALQLLNDAQLEKEEEEGNLQSQKLLYMKEHQASFTCMRVILMFLAGLFAGICLWPPLGSEFRLYLIPVGFFLGMLLFCVIIPRKTARYHLDFWTKNCLGVVRTLIICLKPVVIPMMKIADIFLFFMGMDPHAKEENVTEEEIMSMVNEGHEQGVIESNEAEMITNIFEFGDKEVSDIMTHRTEVIAIDVNQCLEEVASFVLHENYSRFPVYDEEIDNILGVIYLKDIMLCRENKENAKKTIKEITGLIREAHFVPETRKIDDLFTQMQTKKVHLAIVFDEYGQVTGLVTLEDIIEEIMGNIFDEYDEEEQFIIKEAEDTYMVKGKTSLEDLEKVLEEEFDIEEYDTVNGFLISKLERIPTEDEKPKIIWKGYEFAVCQIENKMITAVQIKKIPKEESTTQVLEENLA